MERERISLMEIITVNIPRPDILVHIDNVNIDILNLFRYGITTFIINGKNIGLQLYVVNINENKLILYNNQLKKIQRRFRELRIRGMYLKSYLRKREITGRDRPYLFSRSSSAFSTSSS